MSQSRSLVLVVVLALVVGAVAGFVGSRVGTGTATAASGQADYMQQLKNAGVLRVGCADSPPTIVVGADGSCTGPDLLPMQQIAKILGVKFATVNTSWQNIVAGLQANQYDFAADLDATGERNASIMFTAPSWSYPATFAVPGNTTYKTSQAILGAGQPICTNAGNANDQLLQELKAKELLLNSYADCFLAMKAGKAIAVFADNGTAEAFVAQQPDIKIVVPDPVLFKHNVSYGVRADVDPHSLQMFDTTINNMVISGEMSRAFAAAGYLDETALQSSGMLLKP